MFQVLKKTLDPIISDPHDYPIYKVSQDKEAFLNEVKELTRSKLLSKIKTEKELHDLLGKVLYAERIRLTQKPWKADPSDEKEFWSSIKNEILHTQVDNAEAEYNHSSPTILILNKIIDRYANEIVGNFKPAMYNFARSSVNVIVSKILNATPSNKFKFWKTQKTLDEKVIITGELDKIRKLAEKATIVVVPTHFSNLDSILMGYIIDRIGLPPVTYGAGLNLFSIGLLNYFMSNLGAYKVDRRKKNAVYLELLKNYSTIALQRGVNGLFFPGGTRSRSGQLETSLKLGLLGTTVEAQRNLIAKANNNEPRRIYILPCIINYHFVLEANGLIEDFLKATGKDKYIRENDEYSTSIKIIKFIFKFLFARSEIIMSYGPLLDVVGNTIDEDGVSIDHMGRKVDICDYFKLDGTFQINIQRENEYTRMLERSIVDKFHTHNTMLTSHLVAFAAFVCMRKIFPNLDLYAFLRLPNEDTLIPRTQFVQSVEQMRNRLHELAAQGKIHLAEEIHFPIESLIQHGFDNLGIYHTEKILFFNNEGFVETGHKKLLYYYHNRALGYQLEKYA